MRTNIDLVAAALRTLDESGEALAAMYLETLWKQPTFRRRMKRCVERVGEKEFIPVDDDDAPAYETAGGTMLRYVGGAA